MTAFIFSIIGFFVVLGFAAFGLMKAFPGLEEEIKNALKK